VGPNAAESVLVRHLVHITKIFSSTCLPVAPHPAGNPASTWCIHRTWGVAAPLEWWLNSKTCSIRGAQILRVGQSGVKWGDKRTVIAELEKSRSDNVGGCATCFWVHTLRAWMRNLD